MMCPVKARPVTNKHHPKKEGMMPLYSGSAVERAMKIQEVILRAMSGEITWIKAAYIIGVSDRTMRRWKRRYEEQGYDGLFDRRAQRPSPKRAPFEEVQRILRLYKETYIGFNVKHFHEIACREHGVGLSYSFVKKALQEAGLVRKRRERGRHRKCREPRACFGELVHIDGSEHPWLAHRPGEKQTLIALIDDSTKELLYGRLWEGESTEAILGALWEVVEVYGIFMSLYSDRASWAFHTRKAGGKVDKENLTQVGRALHRLGIEHIPSYSAQGRGRIERFNGTAQGRLVNEFRVAGIATIQEANRYLRERFIPLYNNQFTRPPKDPVSAFISVGGVDLNQIFCIHEQRVVAKDNTVRIDTKVLQLEKQPGRRTCAGLNVDVRGHLDGSYSVWYGSRVLGVFSDQGHSLNGKKAA
jgi:transposase